MTDHTIRRKPTLRQRSDAAKISRAWRRQHSMSQDVFGIAMNTSGSMISLLERNSYPRAAAWLVFKILALTPVIHDDPNFRPVTNGERTRAAIQSREYRRVNNVTQARLARKFNCHYQIISNLENPKLGEEYKVSARIIRLALNLPVEWKDGKAPANFVEYRGI